MPWADFACVDWNDCIWEDWADCEWDKFSIVYQDAKTRTMRQLPPEGVGNLRRPYLEGNPSYVEDNQKYPDVAVANARIKAKDEVRPHMTFKQPYRYDEFQKMKYRDEPPNDRVVKTPADILADAAEEEKEYEWQWLRYLDDKRWTPTIGEWFDNRWLEGTSGQLTAQFSPNTGGVTNTNADWGTCRSAGTGVGVYDYTGGVSVGARHIVILGWYAINRYFLYFDLSAVSGTITSVKLQLQMLGTARISRISIQQGTQGDTLATTDFDAFTGDVFASVDWLDDTGIVEVGLNASGIAYVNSVLGSTAKFCIRETVHDYDNLAPDADALHYGFLRYDEGYPKMVVSDAGWVAHLDDGDWTDASENDPMVWTASTYWNVPEYVSPPEIYDKGTLAPIGTWDNNYRPTKIKVTYECTEGVDECFLWFYDSEDDSFIYYNEAYASEQEAVLDFSEGNDIGRLYFQFKDADDGSYTAHITNIEFYEPGSPGGIDISVVAGSWWADLRPRKFKMTFDEATANVSLRDADGVELYANATYASGTEVYLAFAGADIARIVVTGSGDVTDIEFEQQVEKGSTLGSNKRTTGIASTPELGRTSLPDPNPIKTSKRLPRRTGLRTVR